MKTLPRRGHDEGRVLAALDEVRLGDVQWRKGRALGLVFPGGDDVDEISRRAHAAFFAETPLAPSAFPSLKRMEREVLSMTAHLLGGDEEVAGNVTSGSSESILLVVKAARDWAHVHKPRLSRPEMILPQTAHPAFFRAGHYLGVKPVIAPVDGEDLRVDMTHVARLMSERTVLVVGSAPTTPHGVIDPIAELGRLALERGLLCHVDAGLGGFLLPFLRTLGEPIPPFDLHVEGVTSIHVDLDTYGYAAPGTGALLYRNAELRRNQLFAHAGWPGGVYASATLDALRSGGLVASAWAVMHRLGFEGYQEIAREIMEVTRQVRQGIMAIDGLVVLGRPQMSVIAFGSDRHDVFELGELLASRGWHLERQHLPPSLNVTLTRAHVRCAEAFLEDLREAAHATVQEPVERLFDRTRGLLVGAATRVIPRRIVNRVSSLASDLLGLSEDEMPAMPAPLRGVMATLPGRGDVERLALDTIEGLSRFDPELGEILPDEPATPRT
jgi:glutamate/tyrosine decarboxylase-like PLP-dependent enzyme